MGEVNRTRPVTPSGHLDLLANGVVSMQGSQADLGLFYTTGDFAGDGLRVDVTDSTPGVDDVEIAWDAGNVEPPPVPAIDAGADQLLDEGDSGAQDSWVQIAAYAAGDLPLACDKLTAFVNQVRAKTGKGIT